MKVKNIFRNDVDIMDKESKVISESELEKVNGGVVVQEHIENPDVSTDCQFFKAKYGKDPNEKNVLIVHSVFGLRGKVDHVILACEKSNVLHCLIRQKIRKDATAKL